MDLTRKDLENLADGLIANLDMSELGMNEQIFVACYYGDPISAAEAAGYCAEIPPQFKRARLYQTAMNLLSKPHVQSCINQIDNQLKRAGIINSLELKVHLSEIIRDKHTLIGDKLKAMALLSKTFTDFSEKHVLEQHKTETKVSVQMQLGKLLPHEMMQVAKEMKGSEVFILEDEDGAIPVGPKVSPHIE